MSPCPISIKGWDLMKVRCAVVSVLSIMFAQCAAASDISGVRIGSTLSEASIAIKRANNAYAMSTVWNYEGGEVKGIKAVAGDTNGGSIHGYADQFVALQDERGVVWFVARYQKMGPGARVSMADLLASLKKKFGEPSFTPISGQRVNSWDYDWAGAQFHGQYPENPCSDLRMQRLHMTGLSISAPLTFPEKCGKRIVLSYYEYEGMVHDFTLKVIDVKSHFIATRGVPSRPPPPAPEKAIKPQI
ncbi:hypothetical protein [Massilia pseudoviolaceinigra]|uniref:hypothetical protein n=1 Tax=Massilia pseudoviolaceinigra TaxID=3057165 RepID=UPI0027967BC8|nr:hypothetical protein [Massilia sp. CCM 9206]MDQ1922062.1 hypothetical protein [Massilia sp. CCM 9206]